MKICPKCQFEVDDNFDVCWSCQFSFVENRILDKSEFNEICPNCSIEVDSTFDFCPNCQQNLRLKTKAKFKIVSATSESIELKCTYRDY